MSTGVAVLAWIGLAVGVVVLLTVALLLNRVLKPLLEIKRNAGEILAFGLGIAGNVDDLDAALQTRELAQALPGLVRPIAERLGPQ